MAGSQKTTRRGADDLEEIAPNRFLIHTPRVAGLVKSEGTIEGRVFELTSWRRDGLLARLRARTIVVSTLADQIERLPVPSAAVEPGDWGWRALATASERFSVFDSATFTWKPVGVERRENADGVALRDGWVLRRRKNRGAGAYYKAVLERGGTVGLYPLDETTALLMGYAQATEREAPLVYADREDEYYLLPNVELPQSYRVQMRRIGVEAQGRTRVPERGWPLAQEVFARLGVRLVAT